MVLAHVQFDATDEAGNLLSNVQVRVELEGGGIVSIYSDRAGSTPYSNPQTFADGKINFYVAGGAYKITLTSGAFSRVLRYKANGLLAEKDGLAAAAVAFTPAAGLLSTNVQAAIEEAASGGSIGGVLPNADWLKGRNAADSADLNMFRVNSNDYTEWQNPLYYDDTGGFNDRQAVLSIQRNIPAPTIIQPNIWSLVEGKGDNTTFIGVSGGYFQARDRSDVTGANKGVLYGLQTTVVPIVDRSNFPFDDVVGLVVSNGGSARGTEGIYLGHGVSGGGDDWAAAIGIETHTSEAAIYIAGDHAYGIDFARAGGATLANAALRLTNNSSIAARNAAGSADINIAKVDSTDAVYLRDGVLALYPTHVLFGQPGIFQLGGLKLLDTDASHQLTIQPGSNLTAHRTLTVTTGDANVTLDIPNLAAKNAANAFSAQQSISLSSSFAIPLIVTSTNADAVAGPLVLLDRNSASPAANDLGGGFYFYFRDSAAGSLQGAGVGSTLLSPTAGSASVRLTFDTVTGGVFATRLGIGAGVYVGAPTSGDMGAGTLNLDNDLYKDGIKVVGARATGWAAATGTATRTTFATGSVTLPLLAERVKALIDDFITHGLIGA